MNKIQVTDYFVQITASPSDADFLNLIQKVTGIYRIKTSDIYRCSLKKLPEVLLYLRGITSREALSGSSLRLYDEEMLRRSATKLLKENGPDMTSDWLWKHQCLGIELAQVNRRYNFFYDTRTGKTLMAYKIMYDAIGSRRAKRCLVICPSSIVQSWLSDAAKFPELKVVAYYGDEKQKDIALHTPAHIIIWSSGMLCNSLDMLTKLHFDICFFDESSKLKSYKSEISKAAFELSQTIPSWYNLSATPAPNGEQEYYTQMRCVDAYAFSPYITKFQTAYFNNISRSPMYTKLVMKPERYLDFKSIIDECSIYVDQRVMPMAGKVWHTVPFTLDSTTTEAYRDMAHNMSLTIADNILTAEQAVAMRAKLNQIASGFVLDTAAIKDNRLARKIGEAANATEAYCIVDPVTRILTLNTLLRGQLANEQVVIWANYRAEFVMLKELLGSMAAYIHGGTSTAEKEAYVAAFRAKKIQYLVCHPLSLGMGVNLTAAHHAVYYSMNDSWEAFKQSSERICGHISVQPHECHYWVLLAEDTVNTIIYDNVINKRDASVGFMDHLKAICLQK